ncbi:hypothetical protein HBP06_05615 [Staphylococcus aureus]|nr:hypothetical protein [Staphylococcus aureus]
MFKVNYSILSYYPDIYLHSNLAVGVAECLREGKTIKNKI